MGEWNNRFFYVIFLSQKGIKYVAEIYHLYSSWLKDVALRTYNKKRERFSRKSATQLSSKPTLNVTKICHLNKTYLFLNDYTTCPLIIFRLDPVVRVSWKCYMIYGRLQCCCIQNCLPINDSGPSVINITLVTCRGVNWMSMSTSHNCRY